MVTSSILNQTIQYQIALKEKKNKRVGWFPRISNINEKIIVGSDRVIFKEIQQLHMQTALRFNFRMITDSSNDNKWYINLLAYRINYD